MAGVGCGFDGKEEGGRGQGGRAGAAGGESQAARWWPVLRRAGYGGWLRQWRGRRLLASVLSARRRRAWLRSCGVAVDGKYALSSARGSKGVVNCPPLAMGVDRLGGVGTTQCRGQSAC